MATVNVIWLSLFAILLTSSVCEQSLYYNQDRLLDYARLCQQLRKEIMQRATQILDRVTALGQAKDGVKTQINLNIQSAKKIELTSYGTLNNLDGATATFSMGPTLGATASDPFLNWDEPIYNRVLLDHGMSYNPLTGEAMITKTGIYMLELKYQTNDYADMSGKISVNTHAGVKRYDLHYESTWEISPNFELLHLEAGDLVEVLSHAESINYVPFRAGSGNVLALRYLGTSGRDGDAQWVSEEADDDDDDGYYYYY
ncbi:uncharacterized protein [Littorina saxatilis]|uniref:uncharacterized protein n=1 Tax=Littorina saxatilis TaxID=31220 RepID=UPI0038B61F9A